MTCSIPPWGHLSRHSKFCGEDYKETAHIRRLGLKNYSTSTICFGVDMELVV